VLLILLTVMGVFVTGPARNYLAERGRISSMEREAQRLEQANAKLQSEITQLRQPAEMERLARECLGMVSAGQTAIVLPSESTTGLSGC
jgi:cell division protein FtsB